MSFHFVDRITKTDAERLIEGTFSIPTQLDSFPPWLVAEAIGQLAGWLVMVHTDFRARAVAATASEVRIHRHVRPGETVYLAAEIVRLDRNAVLYNGRAMVGDEQVLAISYCIGPLLRGEDFDDCEAVRARYDRLREEGFAQQVPDRLAMEVAVELIDREAGEQARGYLDIPPAAPFFAVHFPRKPVFPATLLLGAMARFAIDLSGESVYSHRENPLRVSCARDVKVRSFIAPGQRIEVSAQLLSARPTKAEILTHAKSEGRRVATARFEIGH